MRVEHTVLLLACGLGVVHIALSSFSYKAQVGNRHTVGPRDDEIPRGKIAGRLHRAQLNFQESFPIFLALIFLLETAKEYDRLSQTASIIYLASRAAYIPAYVSGLPWVRTICWQIATLALVLTGAAIVT